MSTVICRGCKSCISLYTLKLYIMLVGQFASRCLDSMKSLSVVVFIVVSNVQVFCRHFPLTMTSEHLNETIL